MRLNDFYEFDIEVHRIYNEYSHIFLAANEKKAIRDIQTFINSLDVWKADLQKTLNEMNVYCEMKIKKIKKV